MQQTIVQEDTLRLTEFFFNATVINQVRASAQRAAAARRRPSRMPDGLRYTKLQSQKMHGPCEEAMPTQGRGECRQSRVGKVQM